uniref:Fibronectin type-III domain-containing protein n=1 Tax=Schistocephalus solidus TaxID=70667 RepID=A0A0X3P550_SCHSO
MLCKFLILVLVYLSYGCNADKRITNEYTYKANAVSEAAEQMTVYWNADKLIGGQKFRILTMPADVAPVTTNQQFVVINKLKPMKSYEFTVFLIKGNLQTPIAYTRGQVLLKDSKPRCQFKCGGSIGPEYTYVLKAVREGPEQISLSLRNTHRSLGSGQRILLKTIPPDVPIIITDKYRIEVDRLKPSTLYTFMAYIRYQNGTLKRNPVRSMTTTFPPDDDILSDLTATVVSHDRIDLQWTETKAANRELLTYIIECHSHPGISYTTRESKYSIQNLSSETDYRFTVRSTKANVHFYPGAPLVSARTWSKGRPDFCLQCVMCTRIFSR